MSTSTVKSAPLLSGALLATICGLAEPVDAVPTNINVSFWGHFAGGTSRLDLLQGVHPFGTQLQQFFAPASTYFITVSSGPGTAGWQYEMTVNWFEFNPGFYGPGGGVVMRLANIKPAGAPDAVTSFQVTKTDGTPFTSFNGSIIGGGTGLLIDVQVAELTATPDAVVIIQWNQAIPLPGTMALLALAGVAAGPHRRRKAS